MNLEAACLQTFFMQSRNAGGTPPNTCAEPSGSGKEVNIS
jgi:hypothetical protein